MLFDSRVFWVEKDAREPEQYQDAYAQDAERGLAAIADGVTSGIFSGPWARLLTEAVVADPPQLAGDTFAQWLSERRAAWRAAIDTTRLTWFQRPKMADGGMTTLLWLELAPDEPDEAGLPRYRARTYAIGDSCLFHVRDGVLLGWFPLSTAAEFGLNPVVLRSVDRQVDHLLEFQFRELSCHRDDLLVLCTDAVALWAVNQYEAGGSVDWVRYWDLSEPDWREEIFALREAGAMRYDDSTLMLLRVAPQPVALAPEDSANAVADTEAEACSPTAEPVSELLNELAGGEVGEPLVAAACRWLDPTAAIEDGETQRPLDESRPETRSMLSPAAASCVSSSEPGTGEISGQCAEDAAPSPEHLE